MTSNHADQPHTLMDALKAATQAPHSRVHEAPFFEALTARQLPLESYVGQLRALAVIHGVLEQALTGCADERVAAVWQDDMRKLPLLQQDLRFFEPRVVADIREAVELTQTVAGNLRLLSLQEPVALLGCLYVLEGSTLGAQALRSHYARAFALQAPEGLSYVDSYGAAVPAQWAQFRQRMAALSLGPAETAKVTQVAAEFFGRIAALYAALYPFKPESRTYAVTSLNPEAGRHPVPADPREVEASLRAGDLCWARFPYFEFRYGERGRRYARSDGAWLTTLVKLEPAQVTRQLRWLGRVLATRGMPTVLLQTQLEILHGVLVAALPENQADYAKLHQGAAELRDARRRHFSDAQLAALAREFDQAVGPEWSERHRHTGELLAAAVADEREGSEGTVENLRAWMTDPARFPAAWIAAVQETIGRAQALAPLPPAGN